MVARGFHGNMGEVVWHNLRIHRGGCGCGVYSGGARLLVERTEMWVTDVMKERRYLDSPMVG